MYIRTTAAAVSKSNGAYLIELMGDVINDMVPTDYFEAASSLVKAKRRAREMAAEFYIGPWRWRLHRPGLWFLEATDDDGEVVD